jgi:hypothetical protein
MTPKRLALVALLCCVAVVGATQSAAGAAKTHACRPIHNPYPGTRYEGSDLYGIRATGVSCTTARKVVRNAHRKALGVTPSPTGIRHLTWHGWHVTGDLRPAHDKYVATRGSATVRWRF